ncbi:MAG: ABC transporter permease [Acidimicrobiia bacterium]|nr:ABC transporter permease [Acidimicrobiia bacterium]
MDFAEVFGGLGDRGSLEAATAGWAAAFIAGVAGFFHVTGSRAADRRIAAAGAGSGAVVTARMLSALALATVAVAGSLLALALRAGISDLALAVGATAMFALIYLAIGVTVGAVVHSEVNGSLIIIFVWMFDVFLGPTMGGSDVAVLRLLPTHFPTLVMIDAHTGHAGPLGDLGASLFWTLGALGLAWWALAASTRPARISTRARSESWARFFAALRYGFREYRRNVALWVLLVGLPIFFITAAIAVTPPDPTPVSLTEGGTRAIEILSMTEVHGAIMVPITVAFLAGLAGMFVVLDSAEGDHRLVLAGFRTLEALGARLGIIAFAALLATGVSLLITARDFTPDVWLTFAAATALVALTYGMIGVIVGILFGRIGGLYVMFLLPFVDVGLAQNTMFSAAPPDWARFMPGYGAVQVLMDGAFTPGFDTRFALGLAIVWLMAITVVAAGTFHRVAAPRRA